MFSYMMYGVEQQLNELSTEDTNRLLVTCGINEPSFGDYKLAFVVMNEYISPEVM
jgi:hypothetical protein